MYDSRRTVKVYVDSLATQIVIGYTINGLLHSFIHPLIPTTQTRIAKPTGQRQEQQEEARWQRPPAPQDGGQDDGRDRESDGGECVGVIDTAWFGRLIELLVRLMDSVFDHRPHPPLGRFGNRFGVID
jgi:hypothetical protein